MGIVTLLLCSLVMLHGVKGQTKPPLEDYPGDYIILAPNTIHPGLKLTLSVNILNTAVGMVPVTATILKNGREMVVSASQTFNGGTSGVLALKVPSDATSGAYSLKVSATGAQLAFEETQELTYKREGFAILVQSDKAIYKPGQTIMFRAMAVYPNLTPYTGAFDIEMKDPDGNIVKQWMGLENMDYGVVSGEMFMSEEARLGEWIIKVTANGQDYEHMVEISEYVLPKFEVKFVLPPYTTNTDTEIAGMVEAKYTYGQPVKGTAVVTVTYNPGYVTFWSDYGNAEEQASIVRTNVKVDGTGDIRFTKSEIETAFKMKLDEIYDQVTLQFTAEVTETLTGIKQEGEGSIPISKYPIEVTEVTGNPDAFKPGLNYTAYVSATHIDGSPLTTEERLKGLSVSFIKNYDNEQTTTEIHSIPESGIVKVEFRPDEGATTYQIRIYYLDYVPPGDVYYCQNCLELTLQDAESPSNTFLQITTRSTDLTTGDTATFNILTTEAPGTLQYQIISRGDIVHTDSIAATANSDTLLRFVVTSEMAPSPRLIVFYVRQEDGEVILASINFKVSGVFENEVTISAEVDKVEPGHDVNLDITAAADSYVGILAIDQSIRLLKTGNDITQDQVLEALNEFDTTSEDDFGGGPIRGRRRREAPSRSKRSVWCPWCWNPIGGTTVREVIKNAGMLVFTNGLIHGTENTNKDQYDYIAVGGGRPLNRFPGDELEIEDAGDDGDLAEAKDSSVGKPRIRIKFPETWLWTDKITE